MNPTYIGDIELTDETLQHYGVKGMKWRRRKRKNRQRHITGSANSNGLGKGGRINQKVIQRKNRQRHITGSANSNGLGKGGRINQWEDKESQLLKRIYNAKTAEERAALTADYMNQHINQRRGTAVKNGNNVEIRRRWSSASGSITPKDIEASKPSTNKVIDDVKKNRKWIKTNRKQNNSLKR